MEKKIIIRNNEIPSVEYGTCKIHGQYIQSRLEEPEINRWVSVNPQCPECFKYAQEQNLLGRSVIPERFRYCDFNNYYATASPKQKSVLEECHRYALSFPKMRENGQSLVFSGNPGTGKNHLSAAICKSVEKQGFKVGIVTVVELVRRIRASWDNSTLETEDEIINRFAELDLLVIDEVGRQSRSHNEKNLLFEVIDTRYRFVRPTIVISNYEEGEIEECLGAAAYDRLLDRGGRRIDFDWGSFRVSDPSTNPHIKD